MMQSVKSSKPFAYLIFTKDFWDKIHKECKKRPSPGMNKNIENPRYNYFLFEEKCTRNKLLCYDGLDKYNLCSYIYQDGKQIIKTRYSKFPW